MDFEFYRRSTHPRDWPRFWRKCKENTARCAYLLALPLLATATSCTFWYFVLYTRDMHIHEDTKDISIAAWIPTFGVLYCLLSAVVLGRVFQEYKDIRDAIKSYDIETFMNLRDEDISPVFHVLMTILALCLIGAFMGLKYPTASSGFWYIGSTTYILSLIYWIIIEVDNPFTGVFFIKNVHPEWMKLDCRTWRDERYKTKRRLIFTTTVMTQVEEVLASPNELPAQRAA